MAATANAGGGLAGLPTARFRNRLMHMCTNAGLWLVAVDPAYTTRWGEAHWLASLQSQTKASITVSRHQAAAVIIGRRSLGHRAWRRPDVTDAHPLGPREIRDFVGWDRRMGGRELSVMPSPDSGCSGPRPTQEAAAQDAGLVKGSAWAQVTEDRSR